MKQIGDKINTVIIMAIAMTPIMSFADTFSETGKKACTFISNIHSILNLMSVTVVTVAIIFAGYQIAFAHKRLSDVAPILIGGLLIGGAATIAGWFVNDWKTDAGANQTCALNSQ